MGLVVIVSVGVVLLPRFVDVNSFRSPLENSISGTLGRKVSLGRLQLKTLGGIWLQAEQVRIFDREGRQESQVRQIEVEVELWPLLSRRLVIQRVQLAGLVLRLKKDRAGRWNFEDAISPGTVKTDAGYRGPAISLSESTIQVMDLSKPTLPPLALQKVRLNLEPEDPYHLQVRFLGALPNSTVEIDGNLVLPQAGSRDSWGGKLHVLTRGLAAGPVAGYLGGALEGLRGLLDLDLQLELGTEPVLAGTIRAQSLDRAACFSQFARSHPAGGTGCRARKRPQPQYPFRSGESLEYGPFSAVGRPLLDS